MTTSLTANRVTEDQIKQLKALVAALQDEDYTKVKQILQSKTIRSLPTQQLAVLPDCLLKTLLELNDTSALQKELDGKNENTYSSLDRAYILYRLEQYNEVLAFLSETKNDDFASPSAQKSLEHLRAQSLFHLGKSSAAFKCYQELLASETSAVVAADDEDTHSHEELLAQLHVNLLAAQASNSTPYCKSMKHFEISESLLDKEPDVALNLGILKAMESNDLQPLCKALRNIKTTNASDDSLERARLALECARNYWKGFVCKSNASKSSITSDVLLSIHLHNQALARSETPLQALDQLPPFNDKWTPLQTRIAFYNKACLLLRAKQYEAVRATVKDLLPWFEATNATTSSSKQSKQQPILSQDLTPVQALWWQARWNVIQYYCDEAAEIAAAAEAPLEETDSGTNKSVQVLQSTLEKLQALETSAERDDAILYLLLHMGEPLTAANVPASLQDKAGMKILLDTADKTGDWYMAHGNYTEAVKQYEQEAESKPTVTNQAKLVRALSFVDPVRAMQLWARTKSEITILDDESLDQVNGAELERQELPRLKSSKSRKSILGPTVATYSSSSESLQDKKKSHDTVMRHRSRQRQAYLDKLAAQGLYRSDRPVPPDPERWLPKYERSYNRKRRNKAQQQQHRGAQGGVSEKDTLKLDVVSRQQARANGEASNGGKSTAHLSVSGGNGGGQKKSNRKK
jgi:predicted negative regulator of RcsB-dependent stress response